MNDDGRAQAIHQFTTAILHGDVEHKKWLVEAARAFIAGKLLPEPRGTGTEDALRAAYRAGMMRAAEIVREHTINLEKRWSETAEIYEVDPEEVYEALDTLATAIEAAIEGEVER